MPSWKLNLLTTPWVNGTISFRCGGTANPGGMLKSC